MKAITKQSEKNECDAAECCREALEIIGTLTPLGKDCGVLCGAACCKGGDDDGMLLFPGEECPMPSRVVEGGKLIVCSGTCNRCERPLACRIFPFFPAADKNGKVYARIDSRAFGVCPIAAYSDEVLFDRRFIRAVARAGKVLAKNAQCLEYMRSVTEEMELLDRFHR